MLCGLCQSIDYSLIDPVLQVARGQNSVILKKIIACLFYLNDAYICWMILKKVFLHFEAKSKISHRKSLSWVASCEIYFRRNNSPLSTTVPLNLNGEASAPACRATYRVVFCKPRETQGSKRILRLSKTHLPVTVISRVENSSFFLFKPISFTERTKKTSIFVPFEVALRAKYDLLLHS